MNDQELLTTPPSATGARSSRIPPGKERLHSGLRIDLHTTMPGVLELAPVSDHRLLIHAGLPVAGSYRSHRVFYTRGDIDLFPAGLTDVLTVDATSIALMLQLSPALLQRAAAETGRDPALAALDPRCQFRDPQIEHIAWALDAEHKAGYPSGLLYTESLGLALAVHLLGDSTTPMRLPTGFSKQELQRVTTYIEENLDQDLSLAVLAGVVGMSASHLKTLFKRSTGLPVHEYVIQRRVERARGLLLQGKLPASQVALEAGFAHQSHMARHMRRILGVTPTALLHNAQWE